jgi:hypothetical protein
MSSPAPAYLPPPVDYVGDLAGAYAVFAEQITQCASALMIPNVPKAAELESMITSIEPEGHVSGASALAITIVDENWELLDSGFFQADATQPELLAPIDVNYPEGSRFWWRLTQFSPKADFTVTLTFTDRIAAVLMQIKSTTAGYLGKTRLYAQRAAMTRAEFLKLITQVAYEQPEWPADQPAIDFYCEGDLHTIQPIMQPSAASMSNTSSVETGSASKGPGLTGGTIAGLQVHGMQMSPTQAHVANTLIATADKYKAGAVATQALLYAAMGESNLGDNSSTYDGGGTGGSVGVLQGDPGFWGSRAHDVEGQAMCFLLTAQQLVGTKYEGQAFSSGKGAILLSKSVSSVWQVANATEANKLWNDSRKDSYAKGWAGGTTQGEHEAQAIVNAAGGGVISNLEALTSITFSIGSTSNPYEDFWTGMQRIAGQVKWRLFTDGNRMYYDSDRTLMKQKIAAVIDRDDAIVEDWSYDWENRNIATNMSITLFIPALPTKGWPVLRPGDVVWLKRFGPASVCSTMLHWDGSAVVNPDGSPVFGGLWLVSDIQPADIGDLSREFTLCQPIMPMKEPRGGTSLSNTGIGTVAGQGNAVALVANAMQNALKVSNWQPFGYPNPGVDGRPTEPDGYCWGGGHTQPLAAVAKAGHKQPGLDCSSSTSLVLYLSKMFDPSTAYVAADFANWGKAGKGKQMTVWYSSGHVWMEFYPPQGKHMAMNTETQTWYGPFSGVPESPDPAAAGYTPRHWPGT